MKDSFLVFKQNDLVKTVPTEGEAQYLCQMNNTMVGETDKLHGIIYHYKKLDPKPGFYNL